MFNKSKTEEFKDDVIDGVNEAKDKAKDVADTAKDKAADMVGSAKATAEKLADKTEKAVDVSTDEVKALIDRLSKWVASNADDVSKIDGQDVKKTLSEQYQGLKENTQEKAVAALKQGQQACAKMVDQKPVTSIAAIAGLAALVGYAIAKKSSEK